MTLKDDVLRLIEANPGLSDAELAALIPDGGPSLARQINARCRTLASEGLIRREKRADGLLASFPVAAGSAPAPRAVAAAPAARAGQTSLTLSWQPAGPVSLDAEGMLHLPDADSGPGLFRLGLGAGERVFVGSSANLGRRMRSLCAPSAKQATSVRLNRQIVKALARGETVTLALCTAVMLRGADAREDADLSDRALRNSIKHVALFIEGTLGHKILNRTG